MFVPTASAMAAIHRDHLVVASNAQWPEVQPFVFSGQIIFADPPLLMDRQTDEYYNNS